MMFGNAIADQFSALFIQFDLILVQIHSKASISGIHCRIYLAGEINLAEVFCKSFPEILVLHLVHCINLAYPR